MRHIHVLSNRGNPLNFMWRCYRVHVNVTLREHNWHILQVLSFKQLPNHLYWKRIWITVLQRLFRSLTTEGFYVTRAKWMLLILKTLIQESIPWSTNRPESMQIVLLKTESRVCDVQRWLSCSFLYYRLLHTKLSILQTLQFCIL